MKENNEQASLSEKQVDDLLGKLFSDPPQAAVKQESKPGNDDPAFNPEAQKILSQPSQLTNEATDQLLTQIFGGQQSDK
ncbi:hypothetical protein ACX93W_13060 [Paenibacillus sp. CAU 1782]